MYHAACKDEYRPTTFVEFTADVFRIFFIKDLAIERKYEGRGNVGKASVKFVDTTDEAWSNKRTARNRS